MRNRFLEQVLRQREAEQVAALSEAKGKALPRDPGADEFARAQQAIQRGDVLAARASISRLERAKYLELARWCRAVGARFP